MRDRIPVSWHAIVVGGLIASTADVGAASLINWLSPVVILHAIASGVLGKAAFAGGAAAAVLGLVLQWLMGLLIAAIFVLAASRFAWLRRRWVFAGIAYGVAIFFVMNYVVVPLSAVPFPAHHFGVRTFIENLLAMFLFGLIIAWRTRERRVPLRDAGSPAV